MNNKIDIQRFLTLIKNVNRFLLTSHQDPDGDSIGSLVGLRSFLKGLSKKVVVYNHGRMPARYSFLDPDAETRFSMSPLPFLPETVVVLECPNIGRIGFVKDYIKTGMTIVNIDHHNNNTLFGDINIIDPSACAVGEILYDIIKTGGYKITPEIAKPLYAAIVSDTGRFKFPNTDSKCFLTASELVKAGASPKEISDKIFSSYSPETIKLLGHILETLKLYDNGEICVLRLPKEDLKKYNVNVEDTEGIIDYSLVISGVKVGILFKEHDSQTVKVSLRSQNNIDVCDYAKQKGGGGHTNAAGFTVKKRLEEVIDTVVAEVSEHLDG
ncbi:MAG: hypothetical protein DRP26_03020 [Candidatus Zixiibacteriota bacterium]|nr:MAG: hypothetical protein DRP26_03020 [candidate division Zixibacteria bacterium]